MPLQLDPLGGDRGLGPRAAAVRAAVAAHVAEVDGLVLVGVAAVAAVLGVGGVLELGERQRVVLDAEVGRRARARGRGRRPAGRRRSARSARRGRRASATTLGPAVGEQLELAVAVELVAEQVGEQERARVELVGDARQPRLVDLEQAELAAARGRRRAARWRRPSACSTRRGCARRAARPSLQDRRRASTRSSSCRWSPRSAPSRRSSALAQPLDRAAGRARSSSRPGAVVPPCGRGGGSRPGRAGRCASFRPNIRARTVRRRARSAARR